MPDSKPFPNRRILERAIAAVLVALLILAVVYVIQLETRIEALEKQLHVSSQSGGYLEAPESQEEYFDRSPQVNPALRRYATPPVETVQVSLP